MSQLRYVSGFGFRVVDRLHTGFCGSSFVNFIALALDLVCLWIRLVRSHSLCVIWQYSVCVWSLVTNKKVCFAVDFQGFILIFEASCLDFELERYSLLYYVTVEGNSELFVAIFGADCGFYFGRSVPVLVDVYFPYCLFFLLRFSKCNCLCAFTCKKLNFLFLFFIFYRCRCINADITLLVNWMLT